jgi:hypothetical protein
MFGKAAIPNLMLNFLKNYRVRPACTAAAPTRARVWLTMPPLGCLAQENPSYWPALHDAPAGTKASAKPTAEKSKQKTQSIIGIHGRIETLVGSRAMGELRELRARIGVLNDRIARRKKFAPMDPETVAFEAKAVKQLEDESAALSAQLEAKTTVALNAVKAALEEHPGSLAGPLQMFVNGQVVLQNYSTPKAELQMGESSAGRVSASLAHVSRSARVPQRPHQHGSLSMLPLRGGQFFECSVRHVTVMSDRKVGHTHVYARAHSQHNNQPPLSRHQEASAALARLLAEARLHTAALRGRTWLFDSRVVIVRPKRLCATARSRELPALTASEPAQPGM